TGKELLTIKGHPENVKSIAFSPDGTQLASTTGKWSKEQKQWLGEIRIWDAQTGKEIRILKGHGDTIDSVVFSREGKVVATGSEDRTVKVWDVVSGKELNTLKGHTHAVLGIALSPNGQLLASASEGEELKKEVKKEPQKEPEKEPKKEPQKEPDKEL